MMNHDFFPPGRIVDRFQGLENGCREQWSYQSFLGSSQWNRDFLPHLDQVGLLDAIGLDEVGRLDPES